MRQSRLVDFWARAIAARSPVMLEQLRGAARDLLASRSALRSVMPAEFVNNPPIDLLYALFVAEDQTMTVPPLITATGVSAPVARRWIDVLVDRDLVAERGGVITLTEAGFMMAAEACQAIIESQTGAAGATLN
jgi:predicted transcriptional regulator